MTTAPMHSNVERSRFAHHALAALGALIPAALRETARIIQPSALTPAQKVAMEADKVRELAYMYSKTDPGFASDLYAAAARHESVD
jgi:hypothetical protein